MPFTLTCPDCESRLKLAAVVPAGKTVQCPKCKSVFESPGEEEPKAAKPAEAKAPAKKKSAAEALGAASRKRSDDDKPRRKRSEENEDDDDDDETPKKKKARGAKAAKDNDGDDEGESRPKRKLKKRKPKSPLYWILLGVLVLAVVAVGFIGAKFFLSSTAVDTELLAFTPADARFVVGIDHESLRKQDKAKGEAQAFGQLSANPLTQSLQRIGVNDADLAQSVFASSSGSLIDPIGSRAGSILVIRLMNGKTFDREKIKSGLSATEASAGGKSYYKSRNTCVHIVTERIAVLTASDASMTKALGNPAKQVSLPESFKPIVQNAAGSMMWVAVSKDGLGVSIDFIQQRATSGSLGDVRFDQNQVAHLKNMQVLGGWAEADSTYLFLNFAFALGDKKGAEDFAKAIKAAIDKKLEQEGRWLEGSKKESYQTVATSNEGSMAVLKLRVRFDPVTGVGGGSGGGGGGGSGGPTIIPGGGIGVVLPN